MVILGMCCDGADNIIPLLSQDYPNQTVLKSDFIIILGGFIMAIDIFSLKMVIFHSHVTLGGGFFATKHNTTTIEAQFMTVHRHRVGSLRPFHPGSAMVRQQ